MAGTAMQFGAATDPPSKAAGMTAPEFGGNMLALGLNSGSSFDGIDAVLVDIEIGA